MRHLTALLALALLLGGMVFFAAVVAPLIFTKLPPDHAGRFVRALFPFYYLYVLATSALAAITLGGWPAATLAAVALSTLWLRQSLMPHINRLSDAARDGDPAAKPRFNRAHQLSVWVNVAQLLAVTAALIHIA